MLFLATDAAKPRRLQGVYLSDREIEHVVSFWTAARYREMAPERYDHLIEEAMTVQEPEKDLGGDEDLLQRARDLALEHTRISASLLQRRLRIGYPRAARIIDMLEEEGTIGPSEGGSSREVYLMKGDIAREEDEGVPW
jgi:S-DNA-T family DNA segregation ATPase FtsK/SpoIIIE